MFMSNYLIFPGCKVIAGLFWKLQLIGRTVVLDVTPWWNCGVCLIMLGLFVLSFPVLFWNSNSPLVSGHLPFIMCHQSDCLPWFPFVSTCSLFPPCVLIIYVSLCPVPVCSFLPLCSCVHSSLAIVTKPWIPSHCVLLHWFPPREWFWFCKFCVLDLV